jgi:hypothetical protein
MRAGGRAVPRARNLSTKFMGAPGAMQAFRAKNQREIVINDAND